MTIVFHSDKLKNITAVEDPMFTELVQTVTTETLKHFEKDFFKSNFFYDDEIGGYVEVEISSKSYFDDIELSKKRMYEEQDGYSRYMTDFVSDVEENLSWGGLQVFCKD